MDYELVDIQVKHIPDFWQALDSVAREQKFLSFLEGPPIQLTREFVLEQIQGNWPQVIAIHDNKVVGWCDISSLNRPIFAHVGTLGMGVIEAYRGKGIGKALIASALKKAKLKGLTRIELTVREHNKSAINLYKQFGFELEGVHKNGVCINGIYENHLFMALLWI